MLPKVPRGLPHTQDVVMKSPDFRVWEVCPNAALMFTSQMTLDKFCDLAGPPSGSSSVNCCEGQRKCNVNPSTVPGTWQGRSKCQLLEFTASKFRSLSCSSQSCRCRRFSGPSSATLPSAQDPREGLGADQTPGLRPCLCNLVVPTEGPRENRPRLATGGAIYSRA